MTDVIYHCDICPCAVVDNQGNTTDFTNLVSEAVTAIGSYRSVLQDQLPAPVSSLTDLKGVNSLDTALAARAATYVIQQLGANNYQQARGVASLQMQPKGSCLQMDTSQHVTLLLCPTLVTRASALLHMP